MENKYHTQAASRRLMTNARHLPAKLILLARSFWTGCQLSTALNILNSMISLKVSYPYLAAFNFERHTLQGFSFAIPCLTEFVLPPEPGIMNIAFDPAIWLIYQLRIACGKRHTQMRASIDVAITTVTTAQNQQTKFPLFRGKLEYTPPPSGISPSEQTLKPEVGTVEFIITFETQTTQIHLQRDIHKCTWRTGAPAVTGVFQPSR